MLGQKQRNNMRQCSSTATSTSPPTKPVVDLPVRQEVPEELGSVEVLPPSPNFRPDLNRAERLDTEVWHVWLKELKKQGIHHKKLDSFIAKKYYFNN